MFFDYGAHRIHYYRWGHGPRFLLLFHGFGDTGEIFEYLSPFLGEDYTLLAWDLPHHGQTDWRGHYFSAKDFLGAIRVFQDLLGIERFVLGGYSMGGQIVQHLVPRLGKVLQAVWLFAPAGMQHSVAYNRVLFNRPVRRFWRWSLQNPNWLQGLFDLALRLRLLNRMTHRFFSKQLQDPQQRERLLDVWVSLYDFPLKHKFLYRFLLEHNLPLELFYGRLDRITPSEAGLAFIQGLPLAQLHEVDTGHFLFKDEHLGDYFRRWPKEHWRYE
jgi:pimeloyl-ACP methyl ester carboxylesterase